MLRLRLAAWGIVLVAAGCQTNHAPSTTRPAPSDQPREDRQYHTAPARDLSY